LAIVDTWICVVLRFVGFVNSKSKGRTIGRRVALASDDMVVVLCENGC